ncbi:MAG: hypothetical protein R3F05_12775, partial [Planctomycetota bacterium]
MAFMRLLAAVSLVAFLAACGEPEPQAPRAEEQYPQALVVWPEADPGIQVGGVAIVGDDVLVVAKHRLDAWIVVPRAALNAGATTEGRRIQPTFNDSAWVGGRGPLAARAVSIGAMKDLPTDIVGLGVLPGGQLVLLDRRQRVLWSGRLLAGPGGTLRAITLDRATVLPGGDHSGLDEADPRDRGPGVRALAVLADAPAGVDLIVAEAPPKPEAPWRLHRLDRTGATVRRPVSLGHERDDFPLCGLAWGEGRLFGMLAPAEGPNVATSVGAHVRPYTLEGDVVTWKPQAYLAFTNQLVNLRPRRWEPTA